jgi:hypothetical protein
MNNTDTEQQMLTYENINCSHSPYRPSAAFLDDLARVSPYKQNHSINLTTLQHTPYLQYAQDAQLHNQTTK